MINLNVTADNFDELKHKVFLALGLTEPAQQKMPFFTNAGALVSDVVFESGPLASEMIAMNAVREPSVAEAPKRTRRTKAEMATEMKVTGKNPPLPKEPVDEEVSSIQDEEETSVIDVQDLVGEEEEKTFEDCKTILKKVLQNPGGQGAATAMKLLQAAGVGKLVDISAMPDAAIKFTAFYAAAEKELA